jgi:chemotaxis protein CheZ
MTNSMQQQESAGVPEQLEIARELVFALEANDRDHAGNLIEALGGLKYKALLAEVGQLTREVHHSIMHLSSKDRLMQLAQDQIPDCQERLRYVIRQTEQAANETLDAVEDMMARTKGLGESARDMVDDVSKAASSEVSVRSEVTVFATHVAEQNDYLHTRLSDVLLAQSYQDLTSQVIGRTIEVVTQIESKLKDILTACVPQPQRQKIAVEVPNDESISSYGPTIKPSAAAVSDQVEVDDLLASLGI